MRVHAGVLDHHRSIWEPELAAQLKVLAQAVGGQPADDAPPEAWYNQPVEEVLFVGLSFGGALAELTAFRIAQQLPALRPLLRVVSFGSYRWQESTPRCANAPAHGGCPNWHRANGIDR